MFRGRLRRAGTRVFREHGRFPPGLRLAPVQSVALRAKWLRRLLATATDPRYPTLTSVSPGQVAITSRFKKNITCYRHKIVTNSKSENSLANFVRICAYFQ